MGYETLLEQIKSVCAWNSLSLVYVSRNDLQTDLNDFFCITFPSNTSASQILVCVGVQGENYRARARVSQQSFLALSS